MDLLTFSKIISISTLISNILFILFLLLYFTNKKVKIKSILFVKKYILEIILLPIFFSVVGSLIYSEILGFKPCVLCWYQRILIYPQLILLLLAIKKNDKNIIEYLIPFSWIGFLISLYQSYSNWGGGSILPCTASGGECSRIYVLDYGYITIPFMALSVFIYILSISYIYKKNNK